MFDGAMPWRLVPGGLAHHARAGRTRARRTRASRSTTPMSETSTTWPCRRRAVAVVERREDALTANIAPSESPSERPVRGGGWPGKPLRWRRPPIASADRGEAGPSRIRAGLAVAGDAREHDQPRVDLAQLVRPEVPALERAGPEVLDDDVGLPGELEQQLLAALLRGGSRVMHFLLRDWTGHQSDAAVVSAWPHSRSGSGCPGASTLMTSAPRSPSRRPANGPASSVPSSIDADALERARTGVVACHRVAFPTIAPTTPSSRRRRREHGP